jgi:Signal transduction histidine kinase
MAEEQTVLARATCDGMDQLVSADEPLAGLHLRCGGHLPGRVAIPELLELVRKARHCGFRVARFVRAHDGLEMVQAWIEVDPNSSAERGGCDIRVRSWHAAPAASEEPAASERRRVTVNRHVAELSARLDAQQRILAVTYDAADLIEVGDAMAGGIGQVWTEFLPPENLLHEQPLHWRLLDGVRVGARGSQRRWRVSLVPHMRPAQDPAGFELLLLSDEPATGAVIAREAQEEAAATPRRSLVGQEIAPVLKQPISRIIANAETIRTRLAGPLPDAYSDYAGEIASAGKLLLELLDDLADLEVVESEGFRTAPDRIDLSEVSRQAAGILGVRAREKGITIDAPQMGDSLPAVAEFRRVLQVLLNLIGNAIRYSPEHSCIWVRLESAGDRARVVVADQGPGISEDQQARVFEKFERLGRSGDGGTGLGLYISRRLAEAMGGTLQVESAPGQGARFILEVPADTWS